MKNYDEVVKSLRLAFFRNLCPTETKFSQLLSQTSC